MDVRRVGVRRRDESCREMNEEWGMGTVRGSSRRNEVVGEGTSLIG